MRLVVLPGLDGGAELRSAFASALAPELEAQIVDYPNQRYLDYAELEQLVRATLPQEPFVLLGESFSGPLAIEIAARPPKALTGLVLVCSFVRKPLRLAALLNAVLSRVPAKRLPIAAASSLLLGPQGSPELRTALRVALASVSPEVLLDRARAALIVDATAALSQVRLPVLYLRGGKDWLIPRAAAELIASLAPQTETLDLLTSHFLLQVQPSQAAEAVKLFAARCFPGA
ncbi:MAG: alpha/beta hydrolase [Betaproteobacteria bacterium]|nr:alpha/beta hydrolase [Betaproteobacteria bacterium]